MAVVVLVVVEEEEEVKGEKCGGGGLLAIKWLHRTAQGVQGRVLPCGSYGHEQPYSCAH